MNAAIAPSRTPPMRAASACLALILAFGFMVRLRAANHPYISQWDEAYHALVAKNLTAHPLEPTLYEEKVLPADDRDWTKAGVWLHKPPLPLLLSPRGARGGARLLAVAALPFAVAALPWPLHCLSRWPELWRHESAM